MTRERQAADKKELGFLLSVEACACKMGSVILPYLKLKDVFLGANCLLLLMSLHASITIPNMEN